MQTTSIRLPTPSQWALQYFALFAGTQVQAALLHFLGLAMGASFFFAERANQGLPNLNAEIPKEEDRLQPARKDSPGWLHWVEEFMAKTIFNLIESERLA